MSQRRALSTLGIVLVISLIANALLVGMLAGNSVGAKDEPRRERGPRGGGDEAEIARAIEAVVPDDVRKEVRQGFRAAFREAMPYFATKREAQRGLLDALSAEPFDRAAVDAAFADIRAADETLTASFQSVLADELGSLTAVQCDVCVCVCGVRN